MRTRRRTAFAALVGIFSTVLVGLALPASAAPSFVVDDDKVQCPTAAFTSIQAAVLSAPANSTIRVCPGTYTEQVRVETAAKNGLRIVSSSWRQAVIKAPASLDADGSIVLVRGAQNVQLRNFVITGPASSASGCLANLNGVRVDGNGSALVAGNHLTDIRLPANLFGCQTGVAIRVGQQSLGQVGKATIQDNLIDRYQKGGVVIDGVGSAADITGNTIRGEGPTPVLAQNGIQISRNATATVRDNEVTDNSYVGWSAAAAGILLFEIDGRVVVDGNEVRRNDTNIVAYATSGAVISKNIASDSPTYDGIYLNDDTSGIRVVGNVMANNAGFDCDDTSVGTGTAGTANSWQRNTGVTSSPAGLCAAEDDRDDDDHNDDDDHEDGSHGSHGDGGRSGRRGGADD